MYQMCEKYEMIWINDQTITNKQVVFA